MVFIWFLYKVLLSGLDAFARLYFLGMNMTVWQVSTVLGSSLSPPIVSTVPVPVLDCSS